ncbi:hypothetical protein VTL71DRAFT_15470 [Oculimacula yallundae]|uniref:Uncharacterized protein n=1 Tax=Oculimacula yallundae TaxID=86028 RepID=A0ABR4CHG2_9HELO
MGPDQLKARLDRLDTTMESFNRVIPVPAVTKDATDLLDDAKLLLKKIEVLEANSKAQKRLLGPDTYGICIRQLETETSYAALVVTILRGGIVWVVTIVCLIRVLHREQNLSIERRIVEGKPVSKGEKAVFEKAAEQVRKEAVEAQLRKEIK